MELGGRERGIAHKTGKQAVEEEESIFFRPALPVHCFGLVSLIFRVEMTEVRLSGSVMSYKMEINQNFNVSSTRYFSFWPNYVK